MSYEYHAYMFSVTDWRRDEIHRLLDAAGKGAYRELLDECWINGSIPTNLDDMAAIAGIDAAIFIEKVWPRIKVKFVEHLQRGDRYISPMIERDRERLDDKRETSHRSSKIAVAARQEKRLRDAQRNVNESLVSQDHSHSDSPKNARKGKDLKRGVERSVVRHVVRDINETSNDSFTHTHKQGNTGEGETSGFPSGTPDEAIKTLVPLGDTHARTFSGLPIQQPTQLDSSPSIRPQKTLLAYASGNGHGTADAPGTHSPGRAIDVTLTAAPILEPPLPLQPSIPRPKPKATDLPPVPQLQGAALADRLAVLQAQKAAMLLAEFGNSTPPPPPPLTAIEANKAMTEALQAALNAANAATKEPKS